MLNLKNQLRRLSSFNHVSKFYFRRNFKNPYLTEAVSLTPEEVKKNQQELVWNRVFDKRKYMEHTGELKLGTGLAGFDVEPFPRMKLMKLYYLCLQQSKKLPDICKYKFLSVELTKYRMKIVDENTNIRQIQKKIGYGIVEQLIDAAHDELKLLKIFQELKPWETEYGEEDDVELDQILSNIDPTNFVHTPQQNYKHDKNPRPERQDTANIHPPQ